MGTRDKDRDRDSQSIINNTLHPESDPEPGLTPEVTGHRDKYLLIEGQSQGESDKLGDGVLSGGRVQDQTHLPAPAGQTAADTDTVTHTLHLNTWKLGFSILYYITLDQMMVFLL